MIPQIHAEQAPASATFTQSCVTERRTSADNAVGEPLTDEAREEAIRRAGELMLRKHADFARTGCMADIGAAHAALLLQNRLIAGRSREQVRRMEIRKGLI